MFTPAKLVAATFILAFAGGLLLVTLPVDRGPSVVPSNESTLPTGEQYSGMVMQAWETLEEADVEAIYAPDVRFVIDGETQARDRDSLVDVMARTQGIGNRFRQAGPVLEYETPDGDLYVVTVVEVEEAFYPRTVPIVGFYRVRDGKVIRHVFMDVEDY